MISQSHLGFIGLLDALITTLFKEVSVYSISVPCHHCDLDFNLTQYKEELQKSRQYSSGELIRERCQFNVSNWERQHLLNKTCNLKEQQMTFSRSGTHHAMERVVITQICWEQTEDVTWNGALPSQMQEAGQMSVRMCVCWCGAAMSLRSWCHREAWLQAWCTALQCTSGPASGSQDSPLYNAHMLLKIPLCFLFLHLNGTLT